jgi:hypothetical protein
LSFEGEFGQHFWGVRRWMAKGGPNRVTLQVQTVCQKMTGRPLNTGSRKEYHDAQATGRNTTHVSEWTSRTQFLREPYGRADRRVSISLRLTSDGHILNQARHHLLTERIHLPDAEVPCSVLKYTCSAHLPLAPPQGYPIRIINIHLNFSFKYRVLFSHARA